MWHMSSGHFHPTAALSCPIHTQPLAGWPHDVLAWSVARQTAQWELARRREEVFVLAKHNVKFISYSINNVAMTGAIINFTENVFPSICIKYLQPLPLPPTTVTTTTDFNIFTHLIGNANLQQPRARASTSRQVMVMGVVVCGRSDAWVGIVE